VFFEVFGNCTPLQTCTDGLGAVGDPCANGDACQSALCAGTPDGAAVCSLDCNLNAPCPGGTTCVATNPLLVGGIGYCAAGAGPVTLRDAQSGYALAGCATVPSPDPILWPVLFLALLWLHRRRRK
jgi:uncharacterized protein (TIGR03382 family)